MRKLPWWLRALALALVFGVTGAVVGALVAAWKDAELTTGIAWGLYISGGALLLFGSAPGLQTAPGAYTTASMPEAARAQVEGQQRRRIGGTPAMLVNFVIGACLIGLGALFEIYG